MRSPGGFISGFILALALLGTAGPVQAAGGRHPGQEPVEGPSEPAEPTDPGGMDDLDDLEDLEGLDDLEGLEASEGEGEGGAAGAAEGAAPEEGPMTSGQAERLLEGVEEGRPCVRIPGGGSERPW